MVLHLGIDVGGTNTKCAVVSFDPDGGVTVVDRSSAATRNGHGPDGVLAGAIAEALARMEVSPAIAGIGVTIPGTVDVDAGTSGVVPNIPGDWLGRQVRDPILAATGLPTHLINDARAFALAESRAGAARGLGTVVCMTLGTGIGGGVVVGGRLHRGHTGMAGEIGHQTVQIDGGPECGCGNRGCVEAFTRADVFCERAGQDDVAGIFAAVEAGDRRAQEALDVEVAYLGAALANSYMLLCPDAFVIGGGIAQAGDTLREPLLAEVRRRVTMYNPSDIEIRLSELGPIAGAIGAAVWAYDRSGTGTGAPAT